MRTPEKVLNQQTARASERDVKRFAALATDMWHRYEALAISHPGNGFFIANNLEHIKADMAELERLFRRLTEGVEAWKEQP